MDALPGVWDVPDRGRRRMTIDEAITYIKKTCYGEWCEDDWREAMDMAISALQTEKKSHLEHEICGNPADKAVKTLL